MSKAAELIESLISESVSRYAGIWKDNRGKWWLDLAHDEYGEYEDAVTYGPFSSERAAEKHLSNFSNPGGLDVDDSGSQPPPKRSPNGSKVMRPSSGGLGGGFGRYGRYESVNERKVSLSEVRRITGLTDRQIAENMLEGAVWDVSSYGGVYYEGNL